MDITNKDRVAKAIDLIFPQLINYRKMEQNALSMLEDEFLNISFDDKVAESMLLTTKSEVFHKQNGFCYELLMSFINSIEEKKEFYTILGKHYGSDFDAEITLLEQLINWSPENVTFELNYDEEKIEENGKKTISVSTKGPIAIYIKEKWDTLSELHALIVKKHYGFLFEDTIFPTDYRLTSSDITTLQILLRLFEDGASRYPSISHMVMSWPFINEMPKPPRDDFPLFKLPDEKTPFYLYGAYVFFPSVLMTRETLTKEWLVAPEDLKWESKIGFKRFGTLATEAGQIMARVMFNYKRPILFRELTYSALWFQALHQLRETLVSSDGWDGLFDEDCDFNEEGFKKGLYKYWKSEDVFIDSVFLCNMLLNDKVVKKNQDGKVAGVTDILPPRKELAYRTYMYAIQEYGEGKTDQEYYDLLKEHGYLGDDDYKLPHPNTWIRYVKDGRKHYGTQKNTPRTGKTYRIRANQIESLSEITSRFDKGD